ncbi:MAG: hypothetical protein AAGE99_00885 [Chlamydiota bacterium]
MENTLFIPEQKTPYFTLPSHTVSWEQDRSHLENSLSPTELETFLKLYALSMKNPRLARKDVETFRERHPAQPEVLNLLTHLYLSCRKIGKANRLIEENYSRNPDDLFAKINFADLCLRRKKPQKIPAIFDGKSNLRQLYPDRKTFHISEFRGFTVLMGFYQLSLGNRGAAEGYHYLAERLDPDHPGTKLLEKKLYSVPFYKALGRKWRTVVRKKPPIT